MLRVRQIKVPIEKDSKKYLEKKIKDKLKNNDIFTYEITHKSIDARDKHNILFIYEVLVNCKDEDKYLNNKDIIKDENLKYDFKPTGKIKLSKRPIIIGSGPGGLFSSYLLALYGLNPLILERGESIDERVKKVEEFFNTNKLDPNTNIQFGEGGAGTFSDGKLNTLTKDNLRGKKVFEIFVENGAPKEILYENKPHIGTDILRKVIINIRNKIISLGGEFRYNSCVTDLDIIDNKIVGVEVNNHETIATNLIVLAIGHSARDTFKMLYNHNIEMKPKNFAVGFRIEHPKEMIDKSQYGDAYKLLPSASYKLTYQAKSGRGIYTFCMCPGGFVVNASSEEGYLCVNGMSNFQRDEINSNSAIVATITPHDFGNDLFAGVNFQREIEKKAYFLGNGKIPVQLFKDFKNKTKSTILGEVKPNTKGSYTLADLNGILPENINSDLVEGIENFGKKIKDFNRDDALLLGVEARTSSPIVIVRDDNYLSNIKGIYPCGEGAGYAGGITTSAIDGLKIAEEILKTYCR